MLEKSGARVQIFWCQLLVQKAMVITSKYICGLGRFGMLTKHISVVVSNYLS